MSFDSGSWYILGILISVMILVIGYLLSLIINQLIIKPIEMFKSSVGELIESINKFNAFMQVQQLHNTDTGKEIEYIKEDIGKIEKKQEIFDKRITTSEKAINDNRHQLNTVKQIINIRNGDFAND
jgi:peptidoglycan hydrolase CwlO-like protein